MPYLAAPGGSRHDRESGVPVSDCDLEGPAVWILAAGSNCCKAAWAAPRWLEAVACLVEAGALAKRRRCVAHQVPGAVPWLFSHTPPCAGEWGLTADPCRV